MYIGIDPGKAGGFAVLSVAGKVLAVGKMPETELDLLTALTPWSSAVHAYVERVSSSPQMGVVSAFTFGRGYGGLLMALTALSIPFSLVTPAKWQADLQCLSGGDKNVTKRRAQQLWPTQPITHAIADALLIAEHCRRKETYGQEGSRQVEGGKAQRQTLADPEVQARYSRVARTTPHAQGRQRRRAAESSGRT